MADTKKLKALIDADTFVYACGFAADAQARKDLMQIYPDEDIEQLLREEDYERYALANVKTVINDIQAIFDPNVRLFLTGSGNFREHMAQLQPYKGNRDVTHKPKYYREIGEYLRNVWKAETIHGREADDALGCAQWEAEPDTTVIVSIDKDLDMIPGYHYNWRKKEFYHVGDAEAERFFWFQVLTGDRTDNIPGLKGVGPVKANKILDGCDGTWPGYAQAVLFAYEAAGQGWDEMYENASLLWIQREHDVNWDDEEYQFPDHKEDPYIDDDEVCDGEEGNAVES